MTTEISSNIPKYPCLRQLDTQKAPSKDVWQEFIPVISTIALGAIYSPAFQFGAIAAPVAYVSWQAISGIFDLIYPSSPAQKSNYGKSLREMHAFETCVEIPIIEELIFRGLLFSSVKKIAEFVVAERSILFPLGIAMPLTSTVAIAISSLAFGAVHLSNDHDDTARQFLYCTLSGIYFGVMLEYLGILAPIGAHIVNNTIGISIIKLGSDQEDETQKSKSEHAKPKHRLVKESYRTTRAFAKTPMPVFESRNLSREIHAFQNL